ncbi:hypothetical protein ACFO6R_02720 [Eubacterium multiforme]|uniref:Major membrane immunogen (Membrane-anchored lipoprotein) n=1 Tax=Eubacterium multiforme TaxID=83339 RepID=A0ABT9UNW5_9FIRM|nr:hypothetical protein [Eubacterium multiforme]MDQ0148331.1 major membrane immunogen (membrane-anchored lipoprotein) [Eubacterium multiforme]
MKKKAILIVLSVLMGASLLVGCGSKDNKAASNTEQTEQKQENTQKEEYKSGFYEVGKDLPAGEYVIISDKNNKQAETSIEVTKDSKKENEIFDESVSGNIYVTLSKGEYIDVKHGDIFPIDKAPSTTPKDKIYKDGMFKVGRDIKAGIYEVKSTEKDKNDDAYIEIFKDSTHRNGSVISKKEFKKSTNVTLKDGEYIKLDDAEIVVK